MLLLTLGLGCPDLSPRDFDVGWSDTCTRALDCADGYECHDGRCAAPIALSSTWTQHCALWPSGRVTCWGAIDKGRRDPVLEPREVTGIDDAVQLAGGVGTQCARHRDGKVSCWGTNRYGEIGDGTSASTDEPKRVTGLDDAVDIAGRNVTFCALRTTGRVTCWGYGEHSNLGDGRDENSEVGVTVDTNVAFDDIAVGGHHACGIASGRVHCWGEADTDRLRGVAEVGEVVVDTKIDDVQRIVAGFFHTCAVLRSGEILCWGTGGIWRDPPARLDDPNGAIAAGLASTCAVTASDRTTCGGAFNGWGDSSLPKITERLEHAKAISLGVQSGCLIGDDDGVRCWGRGSWGELGDGRAIAFEPTKILDVPTTSIAAGPRHTCALTEGRVRCWGDDHEGQLGSGDTGTFAEPAVVDGFDDARGLVSGGRHSCALRRDGTVWCWGDNLDRQIGGSPQSVVPSATKVDGLEGVLDIRAGQDHTCAILGAQRHVWCWGKQDHRRLGAELGPSDRGQPRRVAGLEGIRAIGLGSSHSCAADEAGKLFCWGNNDDGQITGTPSPRPMPPTEVAGVDRVVGISAGYEFTCVRRADGSVWCWGDNVYGQLGRGERFDVGPPAAVMRLSDATKLDSSGWHTCALRTNGVVMCWGRFGNGQFGNGAADNRATPMTVEGLPAAMEVTTNTGHTCAVTRDHETWCWGANAYGQIDGRPPVEANPVPVRGLR